MFCKNCGKEINDNASVCIYCGCNVDDKKDKEDNEPKTAMGVLMALLLGLIGLVIGVCLYKEGTIARQTFLRGFWTTFAICFGISFICMMAFCGSIAMLI